MWGAALTRYIIDGCEATWQPFLVCGPRTKSDARTDRRSRAKNCTIRGRAILEIYIDLSTSSENVSRKAPSRPIFNKESATAAATNIGDTATVVTFAKTERVMPPKPFNTRSRSSALGISASRAMETAERLYTAEDKLSAHGQHSLSNELDLRLSVSMFRTAIR